MDHLCYLWLVFVMLLSLFIAALWSPAGKGLTSWLFFVMFKVVRDPCQKITLLLLKSKSVRVIVPESCF